MFNEKRKHPGNIIDLSNFDFGKVERLKVPEFRHEKLFVKNEVSNQEEEKEEEILAKLDTKFGFHSGSYFYKDFLQVSSKPISDDAFVDVATNLKSLHLRFAVESEAKKNFQFKFNFRDLINLKELCIERHVEENSDVETVLRNPKYLVCNDLPINLEKLSLIGFNVDLNSLSHLTNLKHLELYKCEDLILSASTPFHCFKHLTHLTVSFSYVSLNGSRLEKEKIQMGSENLESLDLYVHFRENANPTLFFDKQQKLKSLNLTLNDLSEIDVSSFKSLLNLEELHVRSEISDNKTLKGLLDNFTKLKHLDFSGCVSELDNDFLKNLINLEYLELSNGDLRTVHCKAFDSLKNLQYLSLQFNKLKSLQSDVFKNLSNLETLELNDNCLNKLDSSLFKSLSKLKTLDFESNSLSQLDLNVFKHLNDLERLCLASN